MKTSPQDRFERQAFKYRDLFRSFASLPGRRQLRHAEGAGGQSRLAGVVPPRVNAPLLFDTGLKHKLAYTAMVEPSQLQDAGFVALVSPAPSSSAPTTSAAGAQPPRPSP